MPAVIGREVMAQGAHLGGLVYVPVVGGRIAVERKAARGPHIDEIVGDRPAELVVRKSPCR